MAQLEHNPAAGPGVDVTLDALHTQLRRTSDGGPLTLAEGASTDGAQGILILGENDSNARAVRVDRSGGIASASAVTKLNEPFDSATVNTLRWIVATTTFVPSQTTTGWSANSTNLATANAVASLTSFRQFASPQRSPLQAKIRARVPETSNVTADFGFGAPSGVAAPVNGAFWRAASGAILPVLTFAGVEIAAGTDIAGLIDPALFYTWDIWKDDDGAVFTVHNTADDTIVSEQHLQLPAGTARMFAVSHIPVYVRMFNGPIAPSVGTSAFVVSDLTVLTLDAAAPEPVAQQASANSMGGNVNPQTGVSIVTHTNSTEPANATLSNVAAGYTTLGGKFRFAAVAGAATDYCLFGIQIPAPAEYVLTGLDIGLENLGAVSATTATLLEWFVAYGGATVSLADATHRRIPIPDSQSIPVGAVIGAAFPKVTPRPHECPGRRARWPVPLHRAPHARRDRDRITNHRRPCRPERILPMTTPVMLFLSGAETI
jgi:hypothetical protein